MSGRALLLASTAVVVGALAASPAAIAGQSLGEANGLEYLKATTSGVGSSPLGPSIACNGDDEVTGGGGSISGSAATATLNATRPADTSATGWLALGSRWQGDTRKVTTYAVCGAISHAFDTGTSPVYPAGQGFDTVSLSDSCSSGETALAGVEGSSAGVRIISTRPDSNGEGWASTLQNYDDTEESATQYRSCQTTYDPAIRPRGGTVAGNSNGKLTARCESGEAVIHGGVSSTRNGEPRRNTWIASTRPFDSGDDGNTPENGWTAKIRNDTGNRVDLAVFALCV